MKGATRLALFICTAGKMFTDISHAYQSHDDFLEAFVVESIGSATVENAMDKIQKRLRQRWRARDFSLPTGYSPGYCEWPLVGQKALFAMIGDNDTCITLTDSCLMQPIKSVSGIIGIGEEVKEQPYGCAICGSSTCVYRKILINKK
jgi:cobalamin-dependent methionine synthase I